MLLPGIAAAQELKFRVVCYTDDVNDRSFRELMFSGWHSQETCEHWARMAKMKAEENGVSLVVAGLQCRRGGFRCGITGTGLPKRLVPQLFGS